MNFLPLLRELPEFQELLSALRTRRSAAVTGCSPSLRAALTAVACDETGRPAVVICPDEGEAARFAADLKLCLGDGVFVLPVRDLALSGIVTGSREFERTALGVLDAALTGRARVIVGTAEALCRRTLPPALLQKRTATLSAGQHTTPAKLAALLVAAGYVSADPVDSVGQFCRRGGILDLFPAGSELPARVEFWGDEIESIALFEPESQRRTNPIDTLRVVPCAEVFPEDPEALCADLEFLAGQVRTKAAPVFRDRVADDVRAIREKRRICYDRYLELVYPSAATVFDYLDNPVSIYTDYARCLEQRKGFRQRFDAELTAALESGCIVKGLENYYLSDVALAAFGEGGVYFESFAKTALSDVAALLIAFSCRPNAVWNGLPDELTESLSELRERGYSALIMAPTERAAQTLLADLADAGFAAKRTDEPLSPDCGVRLAVGGFSSGYELPGVKFSLITGPLGRTSSVKSARRRANAISSISELVPGSYVVHATHGIGLYEGIVTLTASGATKDYIKLLYRDSNVLYLPVTQLDLLSKYVGETDEGRVRLNKLGGTEWQRTRSKVKAAVRDMADELIKLYAARQSERGHSFAPDTPWQQEFEERFEYDETPDQLRCAAEIKADMEKSTPMDRLLCGDVGFGKTEVALRAAFKAAMDNRQTVILAPTTILAWQHFETLTRRMSGFGLNIGLLSRFVSPTESRRTVAKCISGELDIVVGTHRLLQKDIAFKRLGLIIIDEEQRFGVAHKEKLKQKYPAVDVLTLSATPIPRTMNMALTGLRDMSTLEEAPCDRHPVQTYVAEFDLPMLCDAMRRELRRGGQVYWLHNRVEDIARIASKIAEQLPDAVIVTAHGQMDKEELSDIWQRMIQGQIDILVCTTIIEAGVDLPNVNTLIIEDADRLGLSQLHQIRGRVGRSSRRAYAYLTFRPEKALTEIAQKRLEAISAFTEFGSGYAIAVRDMELRGAGNLLGAQQHGHLVSVGYDMYLKLLAEAVAEAKGEKPAKTADPCQVDLPVDAFIPTDYIAQPGLRLEVYRRIAAAGDDAAADAVLDELTDRFGNPPPEVTKLLEVARIRNLATAAGVTEISKRGDGLVFFLPDPAREGVTALSKKLRGRIMVNPVAAKPHLYVKLADDDPAALALTVLEALS